MHLKNIEIWIKCYPVNTHLPQRMGYLAAVSVLEEAFDQYDYNQEILRPFSSLVFPFCHHGD